MAHPIYTYMSGRDLLLLCKVRLLRQLLFQFVIFNLFTSSISQNKVRLFSTWFKFLIKQLHPEWIISLKKANIIALYYCNSLWGVTL